jgi:PAS domain S-box-containing protein
LLKYKQEWVKGIYRVLYVDDEPGLLEIGKLFLEQSGQISVDIITSAPAALSRMQSENFDAVVSDYQMPEMDGIAFLKIIRASYPELPFILFTGRGREEVVVEAINNGVDSYLQKGGDPTAQFTELLHRIRIAIERRQAVRALRESEKKYRSLLEGLRDSIIVHRNTRILYFNPSCEEVLGYSRESLLGKSIMSLVPPEFHEIVTTAVKKRMAGETFEPYELDLIRGDGNRISVIMSGNLIEFEGAPASVNVITDITSRKRAENALQESEKKYRSVIENIQDIYYRTDKDGNLLMASPSGPTLLGYDSVNDILGKQIATFYLDPAERTELLARLQKTGSVRNFETRLKKKDGTVVFVSTNSHYYLDESGAIAGVEGIIRDITERKRADTELRASFEQITAAEEELHSQYNELARREQQIRESEERYRNVVEDQTEFICRFTPEGTHIFVNDAYCRYYGLKRDEIIGHGFRPKIPAEDRERVRRFFVILTQEHPVDTIEHRIIMPDGSTRWQRWIDHAIFDDSGNLVEYQSVGQDITERKQVEDELCESEGRFAAFMDHLPVTAFIKNEQSTNLFVNRHMVEVFGEQEWIGKSVYEQFPKEVAEKMIDDDQQTLREGYRRNTEYLVDQKGDKKIFETHKFRIDRGNNSPLIGGFAVDITEQKMREQELQENEQRLTSIYNTVEDSIFQLAVEPGGNYRFTSVNAAFSRTTGISPEQVIGRKVNEVIPEPSLSLILKKYRQAVEKKVIVRWEETSDYPTGRLTGEVCIAPIVDEAGTCTHLIGSVHDITEHKRVEEEDRESKEKYRLVVEHSNDAIYIHRTDQILFANSQASTLTGYTYDELMKTRIWDLVHPDDREQLIENARKRFAGKEVSSGFTARLLTKKGISLSCEFFVDLIMYQGAPAILGIARDITERKKAEEALRESERRFRELSDLLPLIVYEVDTAGNLTYTNQIAFERFGYTTDDFRQGLNVMQMLAPDELERAAAAFRAMGGGNGRNLGSAEEYMARRKDGSTFPVSIYLSPIVVKGRIAGFRGVIVDITERKNAEVALHQANRKLSLLAGVTRHDILNKVAVVLGYLKIAEMKFGDPTQAEYLKKMESAITAIKSQIEFTRIYQDLGTQEPQWIDLDTVMPLSQVPVTIALNPEVQGVSVFADPMLERVFFNLLDNSIHHGERVTEIRVSFHQSGTDLVVVWEDNGIGIAADEKERIFEQGFGRNTGLGMFLIREILSLTVITITETGEPGKGARFEILVPAGSFRI